MSSSSSQYVGLSGQGSGAGHCGHPPWNLSGKWSLGGMNEDLILRHWRILCGASAVWSTQQYAGGEELVGRVVKDENMQDGWKLIAYFGSGQPCIGRIDDLGHTIVWQNGARWIRVDLAPVALQRSTSAMVAISKLWRSTAPCTRVFVTVSTIATVLWMAHPSLPPLGTHSDYVSRWINVVLLVFHSVRLALNTPEWLPRLVPEPSLRNFGPQSGNPLADLVVTIILLPFIMIVTVMAFIVAAMIRCAVLLMFGAILMTILALSIWVLSGWALWLLTLALVLLVFQWRFLLPIAVVISFFTQGIGNSNQNLQAAATRTELTHWHGGVSELQAGSPAYQEVSEMFDKECRVWQSMYPFRLRIVRVHAVINPGLIQLFEEGVRNRNATNSNVRQLFHGTSEESAKSIVQGGFRLPRTAGMFGSGLYFASTPLKAWQYSSQKGSSYMLVCQVMLGDMKKVYRAWNNLNPQVDLKLSWWKRSSGRTHHDSVEAVARRDGGAVNVPEYIVYRPEQVLVRYILELAQS